MADLVSPTTLPTNAHAPGVSHAAATVFADGSDSDHVRLHGGALLALICPSGTTVTSVTFEVSLDGTTWHLLNGVTVTVAAGEAVPLAPTDVYGWPYVRPVPNAAPGSDEEWTLFMKAL